MQTSEYTPEKVSTGRIIRLREVVSLVGLSRSTIYQKVASRDFPAPLDLGGRRVGWKLDEVLSWIDERPRACRPRKA